MSWTLFKGVGEFGFADRYNDLFVLNRQIKSELCDKYFEDLLDLWRSIEVDSFSGYLSEIENIKKREVKNSILSLLVEVKDEEKSKEAWSLVEEQFKQSNSSSDKMVALRLMALSGKDEQVEFLLEQQDWATENLVRLESYLSVIASISDAEKLINSIKSILKADWFDINQSSQQRALLVGFVGNRKISFETEEGREFLENIIVKLAKVNEYTTFRILGVLGQAKDMRPSLQEEIVLVLESVLSSIKGHELASVENNINNILADLG
jgi:aminopeptidase N